MNERTKLTLLVLGGLLIVVGLVTVSGGVWLAMLRHASFAVPAAVGILLFLLGIAITAYGGFAPLQVTPLPGRRIEGMAYPVGIEGRLDASLSRWLWLVKWLLAIPHLIILAFLYVAFIVLTIIAFFAILATGRYPLPLFQTNVGILRWGWRVAFYTYDALATDQYPPFSLQDVEYPSTLTVVYPQRVSRGLALVKWWLLAIPHYIILGIFTSGIVWGSESATHHATSGLLPVLVLFAAVCLLVTGSYPRGIFDFVMGLNRWIYRVIAYATLMCDEYPPFRLDLGGTERMDGATGVSPSR